jgi:hypothetical protein
VRVRGGGDARGGGRGGSCGLPVAPPPVRQCCPWDATQRSRKPCARMPRTDDALRGRHCLLTLFICCQLRELQHALGDGVHLHLLGGLSGHAPAMRRLYWAAGAAARMFRTDNVPQRRNCLVVCHLCQRCQLRQLHPLRDGARRWRQAGGCDRWWRSAALHAYALWEEALLAGFHRCGMRCRPLLGHRRG